MIVHEDKINPIANTSPHPQKKMKTIPTQIPNKIPKINQKCIDMRNKDGQYKYNLNQNREAESNFHELSLSRYMSNNSA